MQCRYSTARAMFVPVSYATAPR